MLPWCRRDWRHTDVIGRLLAKGYREVAVVTFAGGPRELGRVRHAAKVVTNIVVGLVSGKRAAVYGLANGTVAILPLPEGQ